MADERKVERDGGGLQSFLRGDGAVLVPETDARHESRRGKGSHAVKPRMTTRERLRLSYWKKWKIYGRFPWKLLLHVLLVVSTTLQISFINTQDAAYTRACHRLWRFLFFPTDADVTVPTADLYSVEDAANTVRRSLDNYFNINNVSLDSFDYPDPLPSASIKVTSISDEAALRDPASHVTLQTHETEYLATADDYGLPIFAQNGTARRSFFQRLSSMRVQFALRSFAFGQVYRDCYLWRVVVTYDFTQRGHIVLSMADSNRDSCDDHDYATEFFAHWLWLDAATILLAVGYQALLVRAVFRRIALFFVVKRRAKTLERINQSTGRALGLSSRSRRRTGGADDLRVPLLRARKDDEREAEGAVGGERQRASTLVDSGTVAASPSRRRRRSSRKRVQFGGGDDDHPLMRAATAPLGGGPPSAPSLPRPGASYGGMQRSSSLRSDPGDAGAAAAGGQVAWNQLTWKDKLRFFDFWFLLITLGNMFTAVACVADLSSPEPIDPAGKVISGLGCALLWVGILRYLEADKRFYTLILTLRRGLPPIARFMVGVVPILLAYAFFGMVYFGDKSDRFGDFQSSLITLFAVLNGDVIRETFMVLLPYSPVVAQVYLYTFICLFIYVVLNIFIATIELAFFSTCVETLAHEGHDGGDSQGFYANALPHTQPIHEAALGGMPSPDFAVLARDGVGAPSPAPLGSPVPPPPPDTARQDSAPAAQPQPKKVDKLDLLLEQTDRLSRDSIAGSLSSGRMEDVGGSDDDGSESGSDGGETAAAGVPGGVPAAVDEARSESSASASTVEAQGPGDLTPASQEPAAASELPAHVREALDREYSQFLAALATDLAVGGGDAAGAASPAAAARLRVAQSRGFATLRAAVRSAVREE